MGLSYQTMQVKIPFFDATTHSLFYDEFDVNILVDDITGKDDHLKELVKIAHLNMLNPVWKEVIAAAADIDETSITGSGILTGTAPICQVSIQLTEGLPPIDHWYKSSDFGIYGAISIGGPTNFAETTFLNSPNLNFVPPVPEPYTNSVKYNLKPGVSMNIQTYNNAYQRGLCFIQYDWGSVGFTDFPYPVWDYA